MRSNSRRNAIIGWVALALIKRVVRQRAKAATPVKRARRGRRVVALAIAVAVGAATFLRVRSGDDLA